MSVNSVDLDMLREAESDALEAAWAYFYSMTPENYKLLGSALRRWRLLELAARLSGGEGTGAA